jgi:hypothetical protein
MTMTRLLLAIIAAWGTGLPAFAADAEEGISLHSYSSVRYSSNGANGWLSGRAVRMWDGQTADFTSRDTRYYSDGLSDTRLHHASRPLPRYALAGREGWLAGSTGGWPTPLHPRTLATTLLVILTVCVLGQVFLNTLLRILPPDFKK